MFVGLSRFEHLSELSLACVTLDFVTFEEEQSLLSRRLQPIPSVRKLTLKHFECRGCAGDALCDIVAAYFPNLQKIDFDFSPTLWSMVRIFAIIAS